MILSAIFALSKSFVKMKKSSIFSALFVAVAATLSLSFASCSPSIEADTVVYGKIFTSEQQDTLVEAFAVKDGKYVYVGNKEGAEKYVGKATEIIDRTGQGMVMAGCTEGHGHYLIANYMRNSENVLFFGAKDNGQTIVEKLAKMVAEMPQTPDYVFGFGWSYTELSKKNDFPTKEQLDAVLADSPVFLSDLEGHKGLVNSYCLNHSGILDENGKVRDDFKYKDLVVVDAKGYPTGLLKEQAGTYVRSHACVPTDGNAIWYRAILNTQTLLNSMGYTAALEAWGNQFGMALFEAVNKMDEQGHLTYNLNMSYEIENITPEETEQGIQAAIDAQKYSSKHVKANILKLFEDGTMETGTGHSLLPAANGNNGRAIWSVEELTDITLKANRAGLTVHVHTMGDGAIHNVMDAYETAYNANEQEHFSAAPVRNQMVHLRNVDPADYDRMASCNVCAISGILWHWMDEETIDFFKSTNAMNEKYYYESYPYQSFLNHNIHTTIHTDAPASSGSPTDPFGIMQIACTGALVNEQVNCPIPHDTKECVLNRADFLRSLTIEGAYQMYSENERGSIAPGKYADFIIIDKDVLTCDVNELHDTKVLNTYFEGNCVYTKH